MRYAHSVCLPMSSMMIFTGTKKKKLKTRRDGKTLQYYDVYLLPAIENIFMTVPNGHMFVAGDKCFYYFWPGRNREEFVIAVLANKEKCENI